MRLGRSPLEYNTRVRVRFEGVSKQYGSHAALRSVDLTIEAGECLVLLGPSGCGKTTLGKALLQLIRPTAGRVLFAGQDLTALDRNALLPYRRRLQVIFQDPYSALDPRMMVGEIVTAARVATFWTRLRIASSLARAPYDTDKDWSMRAIAVERAGSLPLSPVYQITVFAVVPATKFVAAKNGGAPPTR